MKKTLYLLLAACLTVPLAACDGPASGSPPGPGSSVGPGSGSGHGAFPPAGGTLVLSDPLRDNSKGYQWDDGLMTGGAWCHFDNDAYHLVYSSTSGGGALVACSPEEPSLTLANLAYQVKLSIGEGAAGLQFRTSDDHLSRYEFIVSLLGSYTFTWFSPDSGTKVLSTGDSRAIDRTAGGVNLVGIVADNQTLSAYVNGQEVASVRDGTFGAAGHVGIVAYPTYNRMRGEDDAVVAATDAQVWTL